jgi:putative ABC transport system permease protein
MKRLLRSIFLRTPLGWLQLRHNPTRLLIALSGIAFADLLMFMQLGVLGAALDASALFHRKLRADVVLMSPEARDISNSGTIPRVRLFQALEVPEVETATPLYIGFRDWRAPINGERKAMMMVGVDPDSPPIDLPALDQYRSQLKIPDQVLFDRLSRGDFSKMLAVLGEGRNVTAEIDRKSLTVFGDFQLGASFTTDGTLIGSETTFLRVFPDRDSGSVTFGLLQLRKGADPRNVAEWLKKRLPKDVRVLTHEEFVQYAMDYQLRSTPVGFIFGLGTAMGLIVGLVMVYQILSSDVADHMGEYATFKAMGYTDWYLFGIILEESIILAFLGYLPGLAAGIGLMRLMAVATALPMILPTTRIVGVFLLTFGMCLLSGFIAARRIRRADPAEIFS